MLRTLFFTFARIGLFTFGGGYAMLPMLEREVMERHRWISPLEINDIYAMAQSVPGVIAINVATFVGKRQAGVRGAIAATAGMIAPSLIIIILIALLLEQVMDKPELIRVLHGIRAAVAGLIAAVALRILRRTCRCRSAWVLAAIAVLLAFIPAVNVAWIILGAAIAGLTGYLCKYTGN